MNQTCKVCGEPAAGFHFGAFTCEGCKSFFGRSYNNLSSISECKNSGRCIIDKKNRTTCKACRLRKCYMVGMSKGGSRYGRRSNWFKIHCLLQEQQQQAIDAANKAAAAIGNSAGNAASAAHGFGDMAAAAAAAAAAKQHMQTLNPHMLGAYPGSYHLPDMMQTASPFMTAAAAAAVRHPNDAAAAAALPFFSMMNSLPNMGAAAQTNAFQLPPHLLFPSAAAAAYHSNNAAAAAAAADAAYRAEMYKHRQSVDSAASAESQRYSHASAELERINAAAAEEEAARSESPELCVSGDDDVDDHVSVSAHSQHSNVCSPAPPLISSATHHIHSPIAIRATPRHQQTSLSPIMVPSAALTPNSVGSVGSPQRSSASASPSSNSSLAPIGVVAPSPARMPSTEPVALAFAAKMQSLSPVSMCSVGMENGGSSVSNNNTVTANDTTSKSGRSAQDGPMDLSMKATSRASLNSSGDCDMQSEVSEEDALAAAEARRKFYHITSEHSESETSSDSSAAVAAVKRQKIIDDGYNSSGYSSQSSSATSLHGIFVCV